MVKYLNVLLFLVAMDGLLVPTWPGVAGLSPGGGLVFRRGQPTLSDVAEPVRNKDPTDGLPA